MSGRAPACSKEQFLKDVAGHELTVLRDDGVDRHLRFKRPNSSTYWFDVITWGGRLYIGGDCGTYVFARLHDMFKFFRSSDSSISPAYWSEKVEASDRDGVERFSWRMFLADVADSFEQRFVVEEDSEDDTAVAREEVAEAKRRKGALWSEIQGVLEHTEQDEHGAVGFLRDFSCDGFYFHDWERDSKEFTLRFLWNCYAIVWAIERYDVSKAASAMPAVAVEKGAS